MTFKVGTGVEHWKHVRETNQEYYDNVYEKNEGISNYCMGDLKFELFLYDDKENSKNSHRVTWWVLMQDRVK